MQLVHADPELMAAVGPRIRKSPFFDDTVAAGLKAVSCYNHMWLPMGYGDAEGEYRRLTEAVSMWDVAAQRHLEVRGPAADAVIQYVTTIDTTHIDVASGSYAPMVDHDGILINDPILLHMNENEWRISMADADIGLWLRALVAERGVNCRVRELDTATLAVQGPNADAVMGALEVDVEGLGELRMRSAQIGGVAVIVSRSGWSTQGGYEIFIDEPRDASRVWKSVEAAGQSRGIGPGSPNASERIENVLLSYGTDTGYDANPLELGLGDVVDLDGPDFIGRDALRRIRNDGPTRQLVGAVISGSRIRTLGHPVPMSSDDVVVGDLRSAAWSPRFGENLGLALVTTTVPVGSTASARLPDGLRDIVLVGLPFEESDVRHS